MGDIRVSDLPPKSGCLQDNDKFYIIDSNGVGAFNSKNITFIDLVKAIQNKAEVYGWRFFPCRLLLNEIRQIVGENLFTNTKGSAHPSASGATSLFQYSRTNIHLNNRMSISKNLCVDTITSSACDGLASVAYAKLGVYITAFSDSSGPTTEEKISLWFTKGANADTSVDNYEQIVEHNNATTVIDVNDYLDLYGNDNRLGNIGTSVMRKTSLDAGTEGTSTYYSMVIEINPVDPQLTFDMMLTQIYVTGGGDKESNHVDPSKLDVKVNIYLEGVYAS